MSSQASCRKDHLALRAIRNKGPPRSQVNEQIGHATPQADVISDELCHKQDTIPGGVCCHHPHFTDEDIEAGGAQATCLRPQSSWAAKRVVSGPSEAPTMEAGNRV